ncbi:uncharacterized protein PRCAT00000452001 [Priceomyces carsonii]|uniref:uncharacterized protein n=1 Tax=Priceomyces carsonii TaxID=28549 RepID=UPI002EDA0CB2|nr:unnamed protein product [Priceomyces carsonii]
MSGGATRSLLQSKMMMVCFLIVILFFFANEAHTSQLNLEDALFLTKNSFKELKEQYLSNGIAKDQVKKIHYQGRNTFDIDHPFNNVVNSFFPIDSVIEYNISSSDEPANESLHQMTARYAAFSPILNEDLKSKYSIFPYDACQKLNETGYEKFQDKILILLRGGCTFVDKVTNIIESSIDPKAVIIGNNEPQKGLITMYLATFNDDNMLRIPILFVTYEDYQTLKDLKKLDLVISISTAALGSWFNILLSMVLSPPLLIFLFYAFVKFFQMWRRKQNNKKNQNLVKKLHVYIYNRTHLIDANYFDHYLKVTGQVKPSAMHLSSSLRSASNEPSPASSRSSLNGLVINGVNLKGSSNLLHVLVAPEDFYPTYKCSICLEKFVPLQSRVLLLDCKHLYHETCLSNWLINFRRSCPLCNNTFDRNKIPYVLHSLGGSGYGSVDHVDNEFLGMGASRSDLSLEAENQEQVIPFEAPSPNNGVIIQDEPESNAISQHMGSSSQTEQKLVPEPALVHPPSSSKSTSDSVRSNVSFFSAKSQSDPTNMSTFHHYSRPLQVLSRFASFASSDSGKELSQSIDSNDFVTAKSALASPVRLSSQDSTSRDTDISALSDSTITEEPHVT